MITVYPFHLYPTGIPPLADHPEVELTVVYNACLCSFANSRFSEAELVLKQAAERGRPMGNHADANLQKSRTYLLNTSVQGNWNSSSIV